MRWFYVSWTRCNYIKRNLISNKSLFRHLLIQRNILWDLSVLFLFRDLYNIFTMSNKIPIKFSLQNLSSENQKNYIHEKLLIFKVCRKQNCLFVRVIRATYIICKVKPQFLICNIIDPKNDWWFWINFWILSTMYI